MIKYSNNLDILQGSEAGYYYVLNDAEELIREVGLSGFLEALYSEKKKDH